MSNMKFYICLMGLILAQRASSLTLEDRIAKLEQENSALKDALKTVLSKTEKLVSENEVLKATVNKLGEYIQQFQKVQDSRDDSTVGEESADEKNGMSLEFNIENTEMNASKRIVPSASNEVIFHAYLGASRCFQDHEVIVFDHVEVNIGNAYSSTDGIFDAPVSGVYVFTWTLAGGAHNWYVTELIVDGVRKGLISSDNDDNDITPTTAVSVTQVNAGEHVYVRRVTAHTCNAVSNDQTTTTFSGWLLMAN